MPSPETQRVIDESIEVLVQNTDTKKPEEFRANLRALVANDRQHIHTSLVAAVEGLRYKIIPMEEHPIYGYETRTASGHVLKEQAYEEHHRCHKYYNQGIADTLTIINSIFKE